MCGILGVLGSYNKNQVESMLSAQSHRGPDAVGTFYDDSIALGHNRLSIIDLSTDANQPLYSYDNRFVLVFNGEIYNYKELKLILQESYQFKTQSDSEVLLAAFIKYGERCLEKLNGMFSFVIWDTKKKELFAARDRFGVKPFYYFKNNDQFVFASEIKAIFSAGISKQPNSKVWANYFSYGSYGDINETFWEDIHQLPGGHYLKISDDSFNIQKWYHFEKRVNPLSSKDISYEEAKSEYLNLMLDSIKLRFRSDVPVGFNLSGGLDSSTLLMLVNSLEEGKNINAFSFYTNDERYDELPWVNEMISLTNNSLEKVLLSAKDVGDLNHKISHHQDEPFGGIPTLAYAKLFQRASDLGVKVLLDGQGMDEQWAGYDYYIKKNNAVIQGVKSNPFKTNILSNELRESSTKKPYPQYFNEDLLNLQYRDLFYTKIPRALRFNDRASMAFSTELREPFLDYRLVEYAFALPKEYKIKDGVQKKMLRDIVSKHLSNTISYAPKRPLQTPQREWLGKELISLVNSSIDFIETSKFNNWFQINELKKEWKAYQNGNQDSSFHIWQWISFYNLLNE